VSKCSPHTVVKCLLMQCSNTTDWERHDKYWRDRDPKGDLFPQFYTFDPKYIAKTNWFRQFNRTIDRVPTLDNGSSTFEQGSDRFAFADESDPRFRNSKPCNFSHVRVTVDTKLQAVWDKFHSRLEDVHVVEVSVLAIPAMLMC
jgi:hypothetical protein